MQWIAIAFAITAVILAIVGFSRSSAHPPPAVLKEEEVEEEVEEEGGVEEQVIELAQLGDRVSDDTFALGHKACLRTGEMLTGFVKLVYAYDKAPESMRMQRDESTVGGNASSTCGIKLNSGLPWQAPVRIRVNPQNNDGLDRAEVLQWMHDAFAEWEDRLPLTILEGQDTSGCADGIDTSAPDGYNEAVLADIRIDGVLGLMTGWENARGEIVEADVAINSANFNFCDAGSDARCYDGRGVFTHEAGHWYYFGHNSEVDATMEATASRGTTHMRDLLDCEARSLCEQYGALDTTCLTRPSKTPLPAFVDTGCGISAGTTLGPPSSAPEILAPCVLVIVVLSALFIA